MTRRAAFGGILSIMLVLTGCSDAGSEAAEDPVTTATTATTMATSTTTTTQPPPETIPFEDVPPLAIFLAAIDRGLVGTDFEGDVYLDPESFVNTGRLFCSLLDAEVTPEELLGSYIAALEMEDLEYDEDDLLLGGVVLGASVRVICPEHEDLIAAEDGTGGSSDAENG